MVNKVNKSNMMHHVSVGLEWSCVGSRIIRTRPRNFGVMWWVITCFSRRVVSERFLTDITHHETLTCSLQRSRHQPISPVRTSPRATRGIQPKKSMQAPPPAPSVHLGFGSNHRTPDGPKSSFSHKPHNVHRAERKCGTSLGY